MNQSNQVTTENNENMTALAEQANAKPRMKYLTSAKELDNFPAMEWRVDGVLPKTGVALMYGSPGVGKTFLMLDMAGCVATGKDWQGHKTKQGKVVIIEAEGKYSVPARCNAWLNGNEQSKEIFNDNVWFNFESCQCKQRSNNRPLSVA